MNEQHVEALWTQGRALLGERAFDAAEATARELVTLFEQSPDVEKIESGLNYGMALALLAEIWWGRGDGRNPDRVFADALLRMADGQAGPRRALVWLNRARLFERARQRQPAAESAAEAIADVDADARRLAPVAVGIALEATGLLISLNAGPEPALGVLEGIWAAVVESGESDQSRRALQVRVPLGHLLSAAERYAEAIPHLEIAAAATAARHGADSAETGDALNDYGLALDQAGRYVDAETQYRKALDILERHRGGSDPSVTVTRFNLAELARIKGDLSSAERQFRALEEDDRARRADPLQRNAQILTNFGLTLTGLRRFPEARERLIAALEIRRARGGPSSGPYGRVLMALGQLEQISGNHADAVTRFTEAAAVQAAAGQQASSEYAVFGRALSAIHLSDPLTAAADARGRIDAAAARLGLHHPEVFGMLVQLVVHQLSRIEHVGLSPDLREELRQDVERADEAGRFHLVDLLRSSSGEALAESLDQYRQLQGLHLALILADADRGQAAVDRAWRFATRYRAAETTSLRLRARRSANYDPSTIRARIASLHDRIVRLDTDRQHSATPSQIAADRNRYTSEIESLEFRLAAATNRGRLDLEFLDDTPPHLRLDDQSAVVMISPYGVAAGQPGYAAFVVGPGSAPVRLIDLGPRAAIDEHITPFRTAVVREGRRALPNVDAWRRPGLELTARVMAPLRPLLLGVRRLRFLADGELARLPLAALPRPEGGFVLDDFDISYDLSLRALGDVMFEEDSGIEAPPAVFGAPAYSSGATGRPGEPADTAFLSQFRGGGRFETLAESEPESREIAALLGVTPVLGPDATEAAFLALRSPEILHVSSHGFYLDVAGDEPEAGAPALLSGRHDLDSLDRTGLAFAGANDYLDGKPVPQGSDDGIVYASELANGDFMRTDLVTLSACQTGLGDVARGDGVHGLQRALSSAGARTVLCSLWDVPDRPTRTLFTRFYSQVLRETSRGDAFQTAVRELAAAYPQHPVTWGGFVLVGMTAKLARFTAAQLRVASIAWPAAEREAADRSPALQAEAAIRQATGMAGRGEVDAAIATLDAARRLDGVPNALAARLLYTRAGIERQAGRIADAITDYAAFEQLPGVPEQLRQSGRFDRGTASLLAQDWAAAIAAYSAFLDAQPPSDHAAKALVNRSGAYASGGDHVRAVRDLDAVIDGAAMPPDQRAKALVARGDIRLAVGDVAGALADVDRVIHGVGAQPVDLSGAYLVQGMAHASQQRPADALASYQLARQVPGIPAERVSLADQLIAQLGPTM